MAIIEAKEYKSFEEIKQADENGAEFSKSNRTRYACLQNSGFDLGEHFAEVSKTLEMPNSATKQIIDYNLTRYA